MYPPRCGGCRCPGSWLCDACRGSLARPQATRPRHLRALVALGRFDGAVREAVHALKYGGEAVLAEALGTLLGEAVARGLALGWRVDTLVPVPLAPARRRERGYDQAALLAGAASRASGVPLAPVLRRTRSTAPQVGLGRTARAANVRGAFAAALASGGIVLVDDVATTGATLSEAARALRRAGAREVRAVVVALER